MNTADAAQRLGVSPFQLREVGGILDRARLGGGGAGRPIDWQDDDIAQAALLLAIAPALRAIADLGEVGDTATVRVGEFELTVRRRLAENP